MTYPNKPSYSHGSTGTPPSSPIDYVSGDPVDQSEFDYVVNTEFSYIKSLIDALAAIDSDNDEKVDAADTADNATNATSSYKGNDIDADGDGRVNSADGVAGPDGAVHAAGSLPQFSGTSAGITNTSAGDIFYVTGDSSVFMNNGGSAVNLTQKSVDILVNGTQQASYSQYDTNGDYDVSISDNKTIVNGTLQRNFRYRDRHESGFTENYSFTVNNDGLNGIDTLIVSVSGNYITDISVTANGSTYGNGSHSVSLTNGDTINVSVTTDNVQSNRTAVMAALIVLQGDYNTQTGFTVGNVTQTTTN